MAQRYHSTFEGEFDDAAASAFDAPLVNAPIPRWQRKAMEQTQTPSNKTPRKAAGTPSADRFIPSRSAMDYEVSHFNLAGSSCKENDDYNTAASPSRAEMRKNLADSINGGASDAKILALKKKAPAPKDHENHLKVLYSQNKAAAGIYSRPTRNIPQQAERILDAPEMRDDFYLNLLDWGSNNVIAVGLGRSVYLWNATTGGIEHLLQMESEASYVSSVSWVKEGAYLAVGTSEADVQLWDTEKGQQIRCMKGHAARVGALAWNNHVLSSGSKTGAIFQHDVRVAEHHIATLEGHTQEVCGLKWSPDGTQLASGGNDNIVNVWDDGAYDRPKHRLDLHQAAVKALAWCPWQSHLLATGGGTADRHIRFWNTATGACVNSIDTMSQVCALQWSREHREIVSSHGFAQNQLTVWKYPTLARIGEMTGHTSRVLQMTLSPDGTTVATAAGDESIRLWRCFASEPKAAKAKAQPQSALMRGLIR